jgi:transposase
MPPSGDCPQQLEALRLWAGAPLPAGRRHRLGQAWEHSKALTQRIVQLAAERRAVLQTAEDAVTKKVQQLLPLQGIGTQSAGGCVMAFFGWRAVRHGKAVGALRGLTPIPYARGTTAYERGIATAGTTHSRTMAMEIAWGWLRFQPDRALTHWDQQRLGHGSSRLRWLGMVALARKLLMALWRFVETGVLPEGAALQAVVRIEKTSTAARLG